MDRQQIMEIRERRCDTKEVCDVCDHALELDAIVRGLARILLSIKQLALAHHKFGSDRAHAYDEYVRKLEEVFNNLVYVEWGRPATMKGGKTMHYDILCIFTPTGQTYTFKDVQMVCDNETVLQFRYSAMSDGRYKTATFPKATLCGWSVTPKEQPVLGTAEYKK